MTASYNCTLSYEESWQTAIMATTSSLCGGIAGFEKKIFYSKHELPNKILT